MALEQKFVGLNPSYHDVKAFDCGKPDMNAYLARFAAKNMRLKLSMTWVLPAEDRVEEKKKTIAAYYTLASSTVTREEVPINDQPPRYPVPVILLARLAVDKRFQGARLGEKTLVSALRRSVAITESGLPAIGIILDVLDSDALGFYHRYELFRSFTDDPMRLFVPTKVAEQI
ncbi:MAG: GNAT family N-acetyltransferase [Congregibacter sp.]